MASLCREVGLRLLLSPSSSSLLVRAASVVVGAGFPIYLSFKAIENKSQEGQEQWLVYWAVYACFNVLEKMTDKLVSWFPFYHHAKLALLFWLQLPNNYGAKYLFVKYMRPLLRKHQTRLDRIVEGSHADMNKFMTCHQKDFVAFGEMVQGAAITAYGVAEKTIRSSLCTSKDEEHQDDHPHAETSDC